MQLVAELELLDLERLQGARPLRVQRRLGLEAHEGHEAERDRVHGVAERRYCHG